MVGIIDSRVGSQRPRLAWHVPLFKYSPAYEFCRTALDTRWRDLPGLKVKTEVR